MYVVVWEFVARADRVEEFVEAYAADGVWARLLRLAEGYLGTDLIVDQDRPDRFLTIDRWKAAEDFSRFKEQFADEYEALDEWFEGLTLSERRIGGFGSAQ